MRKTLILLLVLAFIVATASIAYAAPPASWNPPGPSYHEPDNGTNYSSDTPVHTPHGSYVATGDECEICHSPHQAGSGGVSYKLLRATTQTAACDYCHVGAGAKTNKKVYEGGKTGQNGHEIETLETGGTPDADGTVSIGTSLDCFDCHAPHGAEALVTDILKKDPANNSSYPATDVTNETTFCADCHNKNLHTASGQDSHIMTNAGAHSNSDTNTCGGSSGAAGSCHIAERNSKYPHISSGDALLQTNETRNAMDRACLRCHSSLTKAVGTDY